MTVYTYNNKVLKNVTTDKWLKKAETPAFRSVVIDTQEWMAENLSIDDGQGGITALNIGTINGYDYGTQYFYTLEAATRIATNIGNGWKVPSRQDFFTLTGYHSSIGSNIPVSQLKATTGWTSGYNGTDDYGMSLVAPGYTDGFNLGKQLYMWSSDGYCVQLWQSATSWGTNASQGGTYSIRLVKDAT